MKTETLTIVQLYCKRCNYSWHPRIIKGEWKMPGTCAKCRSPYWNLPIVRHSVSEARKK